MDVQTQSSGAAVFWVIAAGVVLAFLSALAPFFSAGYELRYGVLFAGLAPYMVYGFAAPLLGRGMSLSVGILLIAVHLWLVLGYRPAGTGSYLESAIFYGPLLLALALSPLLLVALRKPY